MKVICEQSILLENINIAMKAISNKSTIVLSKCLLLSCTNEGFKISGNSTDIAIETNFINGEILQLGSVCIDARILSDIIKKLPSNKVSILVDENKLVIINCGKIEFKISGKDSSEFPQMPVVEFNNSFEIDGSILSQMINKTIFSVGTDELKPVLTGELLEIKNNQLNIVALDGYRIAHNYCELENTIEDISFIIPSKSISEISSIVENRGKVIIANNSKHCILKSEIATVVVTLISGEFFKYENLFRDEYTLKVIISKKSISDSLERILLLERNTKITPVKFNFANDLLSVYMSNESGQIFDEFECITEGDDLEISFNPRYLYEIIKNIDSEKMHFTLTNNLSPIIVKPEIKQNEKYLLSPLRPR